MFINIVALIGGLVLLTIGADGFISAAVSLAKRFGLSSLVIGIVIVGFGTSLPELAVSINATLDNAPDIALGNVIGSNTANVLLILGLATLMGPIAAPRGTYLRDLGVMLVASLIIGLLGWRGSLGWMGGLAMLAALIGYLAASFFRRGNPVCDDSAIETSNRPLWQTSSIAIGGLAGLLIGASLMVSGAIGISREFGLSEAAIGLTVVAVGTSLPELAAAIAAAYRKQPDLVLGNIIGSNIFNIFGILGITSMVQTIPVSRQMASTDIPVMMMTALVLALLIVVWQKIGKISGVAMLIAYGGYVIYLFANSAAG